MTSYDDLKNAKVELFEEELEGVAGGGTCGGFNTLVDENGGQ